MEIENMTNKEIETLINTAKAELKHRELLHIESVAMTEVDDDMKLHFLHLVMELDYIFGRGANVWYDTDKHELCVSMNRVLPDYLKPVDGGECVAVSRTAALKIMMASHHIGIINGSTQFNAWVG